MIVTYSINKVNNFTKFSYNFKNFTELSQIGHNVS